MKLNKKNILITINLIILILSLIWTFKSNYEYEPIIVAVGQLSALLVLLWETKINKIKVREISKSKISLEMSHEDNGEYNITKVKKNSEVNIKKS